jgi:hypothetical protein
VLSFREWAEHGREGKLSVKTAAPAVGPGLWSQSSIDDYMRPGAKW